MFTVNIIAVILAVPGAILAALELIERYRRSR